MCSVEGCGREANVPGSARGLCRAHYRRWQRYGTVTEPVRRIASWKGQTCCEQGCDLPVYGHGMCVNHWKVAERRRDPEGNRRRSNAWRDRLQAKREETLGRPRALVCECCSSVGKTVFDHDHQTGAARGWICDRCNKVLGLVYDSVELLGKMAGYLEKHHGKTDFQKAQLVAEVGFRPPGKEGVPSA